MKTVIYEFDPVIYPSLLWVSKRPDTDYVSQRFYPFDNNGNIADSFGSTFIPKGNCANIVLVENKSTCIKGCLVALLQPSKCGAGTCAHEALHYIAYCSELLGLDLGDFDSSEPLAYLEQWAANCIWSVLIGKPETMKGVALK